jgi:hypothetical protein
LAQIGSTGDAELAVNPGEVVLHRANGQSEALGDLLARLPRCRGGGNDALAFGQLQ